MHFDTSTRQRWMRATAHSQPAALASRMSALNLTPDYETLRAPEMARYRSGQEWAAPGALFTGDAALTRAVIRLSSGTLGYNYVLGRDKPHAERCAVIDALLQEQPHFQT